MRRRIQNASNKSTNSQFLILNCKLIGGRTLERSSELTRAAAILERRGAAIADVAVPILHRCNAPLDRRKKRHRDIAGRTDQARDLRFGHAHAFNFNSTFRIVRHRLRIEAADRRRGPA